MRETKVRTGNESVGVSDMVTRRGQATDASVARLRADAEEGRALARELARAIDDKKGRDIVILDISGQSSFADCFVNATATNTRMLATLSEEVGDILSRKGFDIRGVEGRPESGWVLVDCGDVIVNLFLAEQREKYQIEKIWGDATRIDVDENAE
ncbi:MAG: ribosome silencing factor [Clostridiales Family XIII bacterium]|jgi:ribosome-associated protein|nr:ribosome silencing factor [Clostridiales Family XIII bacterium]